MNFIGFKSAKSPSIILDCRDIVGGDELVQGIPGEKHAFSNFVFTFPLELFINEGQAKTFENARENFLNGNVPMFSAYLSQMEKLANSSNEFIHSKFVRQTIIRSMNNTGVRFICAKENQNCILVGEQLWNESLQFIKIELNDVPFSVGNEERKVVSVSFDGLMPADHARKYMRSESDELANTKICVNFGNGKRASKDFGRAKSEDNTLEK